MKTNYHDGVRFGIVIIVPLFFRDGVHLSAEGSDIVVEEILKVLGEVKWESSLHWRSLPTEFSEDSPYDLVAADGKSTVNISQSTFHWSKQWD